MSEAIAKQQEVIPMWTREQRELIKNTVAPGATDDELSMFLHVAAKSGLDPLRKQIHFTKMGGRIAFIADINGLQARAAKEPDYEGILHAVVYEKDDFQVDATTGEVTKHLSNPFGANGRLVGAWATVRRKGMLPFTSVVRFNEYDNPNNPLWKTKPAVMIDKCAKSTALRLAYPEQLGGIYEQAELDKEQHDEKDITPPAANADVPQPRHKALTDKISAKLPSKLPIIDMSSDAMPAPSPIEQKLRDADPYASHKPVEECTPQELKARELHLLERVKSKKESIRADAQRKLELVQAELLKHMAKTGEGNKDVPF